MDFEAPCLQILFELSRIMFPLDNSWNLALTVRRGYVVIRAEMPPRAPLIPSTAASLTMTPVVKLTKQLQ
jgi:hypothetical protein